MSHQTHNSLLTPSFAWPRYGMQGSLLSFRGAWEGVQERLKYTADTPGNFSSQLCICRRHAVILVIPWNVLYIKKQGRVLLVYMASLSRHIFLSFFQPTGELPVFQHDKSPQFLFYLSGFMITQSAEQHISPSHTFIRPCQGLLLCWNRKTTQKEPRNPANKVICCRCGAILMTRGTYCDGTYQIYLSVLLDSFRKVNIRHLVGRILCCYCSASWLAGVQHRAWAADLLLC